MIPSVSNRERTCNKCLRNTRNAASLY